MDLNIFLILILSHIVFDFVFQGNKILCLRFPEVLGERKTKSNTIKGNLIHSIIHFIGVYTITLLFSMVRGQAISISFWVVLIISIFHFAIDETKSVLYIRNKSTTTNIWVFLIDQLSHLLIIVGTLKVVEKIDIINIFREKLINDNFLVSEKSLLVIIFIFISTWVTGVFIKILLGYLTKRNNRELTNHIESSEALEDVNESEKDSNENDKKEESNLNGLKHSAKGTNINGGPNLKENEVASTKDEEEKDKASSNESNDKKEDLDQGAPNGGFIIGILERIFIVISIVIDYPMMIGFVLTVKSVARFKKLSNDSFAEYFIIGTFLSFIPAILAGLIIKWLII